MEMESNKEYLARLLDNVEIKINEREFHPFKIVDIRENGLLAKIYGLYGYIAFQYMPWSYKKVEHWFLVFPYLQEVDFSGKIYIFEKNPIKIVLDGRTNSMDSYELVVGSSYQGIVLEKTLFGFIVEIGYSFNWKFGSIPCFIHRNHCDNQLIFDSVNKGDIIDSLFLGYGEKGEKLLGHRKEIIEWYNGEIDRLMNQVVLVRVVKPPNDWNHYIVSNKYFAKLPILKSFYPSHRNQIKINLRNLKDGDVVRCRVVSIDKFKKTISLVLDHVSDDHANFSSLIEGNTLTTITDTSIIEKLKLVGRTVVSQVSKEVDKHGVFRTSFYFDNRLRVKITTLSCGTKLSRKYRALAEEKVEDGQLLNCDVLSVDNKYVYCRWNDESMKSLKMNT